MAKISINEAAKRFEVSRPTLLKHLKSGKISGEKDHAKGWQIDTSELARVYTARGEGDGKVSATHLPQVAKTLQAELEDRIKALESDLNTERKDREIAQALADERAERLAEQGRRLDQLLPLLTNQRKKRSWWPWRS